MTGTENRWPRTRGAPKGDDYDARYDAREAAGLSVHGEADLIMRYAPSSVLDAGCGTGRVARELARRGVDVVGVDIDVEMLATAKRRSPELAWLEADLASVDLGRTFATVVLAGNVMIFLTPGTEQKVLANLVRHLEPGGVLIAGFQLHSDQLSIERYDRLAAAAGLTLAERWSTWDGAAWTQGGDYAVSVHRASGRGRGTPNT